jgi:hypothetical protein
MMGFLDKLLGRSKAVAGEVAGKGKELAGDVKEETEGMIGPEPGGPAQGGEGSHDDTQPSGSAT